MFFFESTKRLAKEFFEFKKYRALKPVFAVIIGIILLPLAIIFMAFLGELFLFSIFYSFIEAPVKYLHKIVGDEGQKVMHATQFIIYLISWPALFLLYFIYASITVSLVIEYFLAQVFGYLVSLGGFKFHISPYEKDIALDEEPLEHTPSAIGYIAVFGLVVLVLLIVGITLYSILYMEYREALFATQFAPVLTAAVLLFYFPFTGIYIPCAFRGKKVAPKLEEETSPKEEK